MKKMLFLFYVAAAFCALEAFSDWRPQASTNAVTTNEVRIVKFGIEHARNADGNCYSIGAFNRFRADMQTNGYYTLRFANKDAILYHDFDVDGDGDAASDTVQCHPLDLSITNPITPVAPFYDTTAGSQRFVGGATIYHANIADSSFTEDGLNMQEEGANNQPRRNWTFFHEIYERHSPFRMYYLVLWPKEDFMNGGADYAVSFDAQSQLRHLVMRYYMGIEGFRWVVRDGTQCYISETVYKYADETPGETGGRIHTCSPTAVNWAIYNPTAPYAIDFNTNTSYSAHTFTNVTAVGHYMFKDKLISGYVGYKWYTFEADALVTRKERPSENIAMAKISGGASPDFYMSTCEVPYELWRKVHRLARYNGFAGPRGFSFDRFGAMGSMGFVNASSNYVAHHSDEPVTDLTYYDVLAWCNALSQQETKTPCYYTDAAMTNVFREVQRNLFFTDQTKPTIYVKWDADGYRLPTVTEWSEAFDSATTNAAYAWISNTSTSQTHAVGVRTAGTNGLYDMAGNVWELTWAYSNSVSTSQLTTVMALGGDFRFPSAPTSTSASAYGDTPFSGSGAIGFRLVRRASGLAAPSLSTNLSASVPSWTISSTLKTATSTARQLTVPITNWLTMVDITATNFFMAQTELTYAKWRPVYDWAVENGYSFDFRGDMGSMAYWGFGTNTNSRNHGPQEPVAGISWYDAILWCNALSELENKTLAYYADANLTFPSKTSCRFRAPQMLLGELSRAYTNGTMTSVNGFTPGSAGYWSDVYIKTNATGYRLPTTNRFEFAAAAGGTPRGGLINDTGMVTVAWMADNSGLSTRDVGTKTANAWGLYDMYGNVAEMGEEKGVAGNAGYDWRKGGSFMDTIHYLFTGDTTSQSLGLPYPDIGFRPVRYK